MFYSVTPRDFRHSKTVYRAKRAPTLSTFRSFEIPKEKWRFNTEIKRVIYDTTPRIKRIVWPRFSGWIDAQSYSGTLSSRPGCRRRVIRRYIITATTTHTSTAPDTSPQLPTFIEQIFTIEYFTTLLYRKIIFIVSS